MGLLDLFTGDASKKAAKQNTIAINNAVSSGTSSLNTGATNALGLLGTGTNGNAGNAMSALTGGYTQARGDVNAGYDAAAPALSQLGSQYAPMVAGGQRAFDAFLDGSGANGAEGSARATASFQEAPGYAYQRDQALEGVMRSAAARGGLAGGNATADILKTATGLADQSWQQHLDNLKTGAGFYQTGLAGQSQGLAAQAGANVARGTALGALGTGLGTGQAGLYGSGAGVQSGLGTSLANLQLGGAQSLVQNNNNLAASQNAAGANILGGILGLGGLAFGGAGTAAGKASSGANVSPYAGNSFLSGLSNIFG